MHSKPTIIFFGTSHYSVIVLEKLRIAGYTPELIVTTPDKPAGKHLALTPSPVKVWALAYDMRDKIRQPETLKNNQDFITELKNLKPDLSIVVAYGKIIPEEIIEIPKNKTINIHASLLPALRGASPIETAILENIKETGVTIMQIDSKMDHGPIIAQEKVIVEPWPPQASTLGEKIVNTGAELLLKILPDILSNTIKVTAQDHTKATYTKKIEKKDGELDLTSDAYQNYLKIQAFHDWPGTFFFVEKNNKKIRVKITSVIFNPDSNTLTILKVIPESKKEINYTEFLKSFNS